MDLISPSQLIGAMKPIQNGNTAIRSMVPRTLQGYLLPSFFHRKKYSIVKISATTRSIHNQIGWPSKLCSVPAYSTSSIYARTLIITIRAINASTGLEKVK